MIRTMAGLKRHAALSVCSIALISAACSDDDDGIFDGGAGTSSGAGNAGKANGGSAGSTAGSNSGGTTAGSNTTGGKANAGASGGVGTSAAGTSGSAGEAGAGMAGMAGMGGEAGGEGGEGGDGAQGGANEGGAGGEGGAPFIADVLDNPGFETGTGTDIPGWTNEGTTGAAFIEYSSPHTGFGRLGHWTKWESNASPPYTARTYQTVGPIPNGTYSFSMWVDRGWFEEQYLFARDFDAGDAAAEKTMVTTAAEAPAGYVKITLSGIVVTSGKCTVGVYSAAPAGTYTNFDDAELTLE